MAAKGARLHPLAAAGFAVVCVLAMARSAHAAGIACPDAPTATERAICTDVSLGVLAAAVIHAEQEAGRQFGRDAQGVLHLSRQRWTARRDGCGADAACLVRAHLHRLLGLLGHRDPDEPSPADALTGRWHAGAWDTMEATALGMPLGDGTVLVNLFATFDKLESSCLFTGVGTVQSDGSAALQDTYDVMTGDNSMASNHARLSVQAMPDGALLVGTDPESRKTMTSPHCSGPKPNPVLTTPIAPASLPHLGGACSSLSAAGEPACMQPNLRALDSAVAALQAVRASEFRSVAPSPVARAIDAARATDFARRDAARAACGTDAACVWRTVLARLAVLDYQTDPFEPGPMDPVLGRFVVLARDNQEMTTVSLLRLGADQALVSMDMAGWQPSYFCNAGGLGQQQQDGTVAVTLIGDQVPHFTLTRLPSGALQVHGDASGLAAMTAKRCGGLPADVTPFGRAVPPERLVP